MHSAEERRPPKIPRFVTPPWDNEAVSIDREEQGPRIDFPVRRAGPPGGGCSAEHEVQREVRNGVLAGACGECREIRFRCAGGSADPWEALASLFGDYRLVGRIDAIRAPAAEVLAYRPRRPENASALEAAPPHRWFKAADRLWMCHDRSLLLLAREAASS